MYTYPFDLHITYNAGVKIGDRLFFSSNLFNGLFVLDYQSGKIEFLGMDENEKVFPVNLHQRAFIWRDKIVFVPMRAKNLLLLDIANGEKEYIKLNDWNGAIGIQSVLYEDTLWIFYESKQHFLLRVNLITKSVEQISQNTDIYSSECRSNKTAFYSSPSVSDNKIYAPIWRDKHIMCIDPICGDYEVIKINMPDLQLTSVAVYKEGIYFSSFNNTDLHRYDLCSGGIATFKGNITANVENGYVYPIVASVGDKICIMPDNGEALLLLGDNTIESLTHLPYEYGRIVGDKRENWRLFNSFSVCGDDELTINPYSTNRELIINVNTGECIANQLLFDREYIDDLFARVHKPAFLGEEKTRCNGIVPEGEFLMLADFIREI